MHIWSSMDTTSSNKHYANGKLEVTKPNTMTVERCQRMRGHLPFWGTSKVLHFKKMEHRHDAQQSEACKVMGVYKHNVEIA